MKKLLVASLFATVSLPALAADAVYEVPEAPVSQELPPVAFTWSGGYLGLQGGGGWTNGDFSLGGVTTREHFDGGLLGAFGGWNYQFDNNFVAGVEGDLYYNWNESDVQGIGDAGTDLSGSVRGRIGYAMDRTLVYATAGWTAASGYSDIPGVVDSSKTLNGYTVGAGVDQAITDNIFGRVEYRFNDYGSKNIGPTSLDLKQHTVTVGVGVKF